MSRIQFRCDPEMMFFTLICVELGQRKPVSVSIGSLVQKYAALKLNSNAKMLLKQGKPFRNKKPTTQPTAPPSKTKNERFSTTF